MPTTEQSPMEHTEDTTNPPVVETLLSNSEQPTILPANTFIPHPHPNKKSFASTTAFKTYFYISTVPLWNSLPQNVIDSRNSSVFKSRLKDHYNFTQ